MVKFDGQGNSIQSSSLLLEKENEKKKKGLRMDMIIWWPNRLVCEQQWNEMRWSINLPLPAQPRLASPHLSQCPPIVDYNPRRQILLFKSINLETDNRGVWQAEAGSGRSFVIPRVLQMKWIKVTSLMVHENIIHTLTVLAGMGFLLPPLGSPHPLLCWTTTTEPIC